MKPSDLIDQQIAGYTDWRGVALEHLRKIINASDASLVEEWKWDVPVWTKNGLVCAISAFKDHVKINFFKGAKLSDPRHLLNAGMESKAHRSIDLGQSDKISASELQDLVREAISLNQK